MRLALPLALLAALLATLWFGWAQWRAASDLRAENAALVRQAEAARASEAVARAQLARERQRAASQAETLEQLRRAPDVPLPPRTRDLLRSLP